MTPLLQFLDTHVNKPFKDGMKVQWEDWIENRDHKRVHNIFKKIATDELILGGFRVC